MTGSELVKAVGFGVRDVNETLYSPLEKFVYLQEGIKVVALELARRYSATAAASAQLSVDDQGEDLPNDYLATFTATMQGCTAPLALVAPPYTSASSGIVGYYIKANKLHLVNTPDQAITIDLVYGAKPALGWLALPADDDAAKSALAAELPFDGKFDLPLTEFLKMRCLNRNEYDTRVEQGLYGMLLRQAADVASMDSLQIEEPVRAGRYNFSGRLP